METLELVQIIENAKKPVSMWEHDPDENNGFFHYYPNLGTLSLDDQPIGLEHIDFGESMRYTGYLTIPNGVKRLVLLASDISTKAHEENQGYRFRMNLPLITINKKGIVYVAGGILFSDEETLSRLWNYFDVECAQVLECNRPNHGGMDNLLGLKQLDSALQFASRGGEWATSPGYAHLCLGHSPFGKND